MKIIELEYDNETWQLPLRFIAEHRANYYKNKGNSNYQEEVDFVMEDDYEWIDWLTNNMDLNEFEHVVKKIIKDTDKLDWCNPESSRITEIDAILGQGDGDKMNKKYRFGSIWKSYIEGEDVNRFGGLKDLAEFFFKAGVLFAKQEDSE